MKTIVYDLSGGVAFASWLQWKSATIPHQLTPTWKKVIVLLIHYITMLNISLLIFWWIEYFLLMFMQLCIYIYIYHHHCIEYEPFWMTIYWCCFVIISLCSPISNIRSVNMQCRHFNKNDFNERLYWFT